MLVETGCHKMLLESLPLVRGEAETEVKYHAILETTLG
jgi:hypothetical protein